MRLLLDINILLDVVFQRQGELASSSLISRCGHEHEAWLAWHSLATLFYLIERQASSVQARAFIVELLGWVKIAPTTHADAVQALSWPMPDFEDALQAAAAKACGASFIITRNEKDFFGSPIPALTPEDFLEQ
ncbi:MAG: PIN domain-containing protein [Proteobacteria bacterium]|nr:PIN domain-containing protein [Pseudomonadota bacterium]